MLLSFLELTLYRGLISHLLLLCPGLIFVAVNLNLFVSIIFCLGIPFLSSRVHAAGKKPPPASITFHLQAGQGTHPKMSFQAPGTDKKFERAPAIGTRDISTFSPFLAEDGSYGATFHLTPRGAGRIGALSTQAIGKWLLAAANGRPVNVVYIDAPVRDGKLIIWKGLKRDDILRYDLIKPRTGEDKKQWKKRRKLVKDALKK